MSIMYDWWAVYNMQWIPKIGSFNSKYSLGQVALHYTPTIYKYQLSKENLRYIDDKYATLSIQVLGPCSVTVI